MRRGGETPSCEGCGVLYSVEEVACSDRHGVQVVKLDESLVDTSAFHSLKLLDI